MHSKPSTRVPKKKDLFKASSTNIKQTIQNASKVFKEKFFPSTSRIIDLGKSNNGIPVSHLHQPLINDETKKYCYSNDQRLVQLKKVQISETSNCKIEQSPVSKKQVQTSSNDVATLSVTTSTPGRQSHTPQQYGCKEIIATENNDSDNDDNDNDRYNFTDDEPDSDWNNACMTDDDKDDKQWEDVCDRAINAQSEFMRAKYRIVETPKQLLKEDGKGCLFFDFTDCFTLDSTGNDVCIRNSNNNDNMDDSKNHDNRVCSHQRSNHNKYHYYHSFNPDPRQNSSLDVTELGYDEGYDINETYYTPKMSIKNDSYWLYKEHGKMLTYSFNHKKDAKHAKSNILYIIGKNSFKLHTKVEIKFKLTYVDDTFIGLISLPTEKLSNEKKTSIMDTYKRQTPWRWTYSDKSDCNKTIEGLINNSITDYTGISTHNGDLYERGRLLDKSSHEYTAANRTILTLEFDGTCSPCRVSWYVHGNGKDKKRNEHVVEMDINLDDNNDDDTGLYPIISVGRCGNVGMISQWKICSKSVYHQTILECVNKYMLEYPFPKEIVVLIVNFLEKTGIDYFDKHINAKM